MKTLQAGERITDLIVSLFPVSRELIQTSLTRLVDVRETVSAIGPVVLRWAASSAFGALVGNVNRAWADRPRAKAAMLPYVTLLICMFRSMII